jgi:glycosyltransferase involved in cell wall biosynthesis
MPPSPMNLLYVSDSTTVSGAEMMLLHYVDRFRPPAYRVHVLLRDTNARLCEALADRGVEFTRTATYSKRILESTPNPAALLEYAVAFKRTAREMRRIMTRCRTALVHSISYPASLYAAVALRPTGIPQIWHEHNIKHRHALNGLLYRYAASTSARVVGPSDAVTSNLARFGIPAEKLTTIYNGIDLSRFVPDDRRAAEIRAELGLSPQQPAVGLFGQMLPHKGHHSLIGAMGHLAGSHPSLRCFFVGALENPPYQAELQARIEREGLGARFTFTGWRQDVPHVIRAMDIVVVATTTPEPAALALLEAMAMGRPVVATRTGGTPELVVDGETGLLYAPGDEAALAACLDRLLRDRDSRLRMGVTGRSRVERCFSLERHIADIQALYRAAAAQGTPRMAPTAAR